MDTLDKAGSRLRAWFPWTWIGLLLTVLGVALQFVPLTRDLHYEYAAVVAVAASLSAGAGALIVWRRLPHAFPESGSLAITVGRAVLVSLIPLPVGILRNLLLSPCGIMEGVAWYALLVPPAAFMGVVVALVAAALGRRRWSRLTLLAVLWSASLLRGAWEAATGPHIFLYAWQVGFFPGGSWDADLPISPLLLAYRFAHVLIAFVLAGVILELRRPARRIASLAVPAAFLAATTLTLMFFRSEIGLSRTDRWLRRELGDTARTRYATIYFDASRTDSLELWRAVNYLDFHVSEHARALGISDDPDSVAHIDFYAYSSPAEQKRLVGTSSASFTKPWRRTLHLTFARVPSTLRHELAHIVLEPFGNPLGISWSNGVLEGWAVALDHQHDATRLYAHARAMSDLRYAPPVERIMGIGGFAAHRSSVSYGTAGSFARWLLDKFGSAPFRQAYASGNIEEAYGRPEADIVREYERFLASLPPTSAIDSARVRYLYGGGSFFLQRCLRRIGRLNGEGYAALMEERFDTALERFRASMREGVTYAARGGVLQALHGAERYQELVDSAGHYDLDTASFPLLPYLVERSDALWALGRDAERAAMLERAFRLGDQWTRYRAALRLSLNSVQMRQYFLKPMPVAQRLALIERAAPGFGETQRLLLRAIQAAQLATAFPLTAARIGDSALGELWRAAAYDSLSSPTRIALIGLTRSLADTRMLALTLNGRRPSDALPYHWALQDDIHLASLDQSAAEMRAFADWIMLNGALQPWR